MTERVMFHFPVEVVETVMKHHTKSSIVWHHCQCGCEGHIAFARDDHALWMCSTISGDPCLRLSVFETRAALEAFLAKAQNEELRMMMRGLFPKAGSA